jgi:hypothetical protein
VINDEQYVSDGASESPPCHRRGRLRSQCGGSRWRAQPVIGIIVPDTLSDILVNDNPYYYPIVLQGSPIPPIRMTIHPAVDASFDRR